MDNLMSSHVDKKVDKVDEMVTSQQHHDTNSVNGETINHNVNEAQTLADATCDPNDTFGTEENFVNPWQSGQGANDNGKRLV